MLAFVGLGGCGGNVADEAAKRGFLTGAINYSEKDLESLVEVKNVLKLSGSDGVGHNRDEAISLLSNQYQAVLDFIKEHFINQFVDVIFFPFSTGGGTGSGIAPLIIDLCINEFPEKVFVAIPILPDHTEVAVSQNNCAKAFEELSEIDVAVFPADNQILRAEDENLGRNKLWDTMNKRIVDVFELLYSYTEKNSKDGNFDKKDLITTLSTRGIGTVSTTTINNTVGGTVDVSKAGITERIHASWSQSIFVPVEYGRVMSAAVITNGDDSLMSFVSADMIFKPFSSGIPIDLFEGNYHDADGEITTVLTGLSWIKTRMSEVDERIQENEAKIELIIEDSERDKYSSRSTGILDKMRSKSDKKVNPVDLLKKYKR